MKKVPNEKIGHNLLNSVEMKRFWKIRQLDVHELSWKWLWVWAIKRLV